MEQGNLEGVFTDNQPGINAYHVSVMKDEAVEALNVCQNGKYIDCTMGGGGHTLEIVKRGGRVLSIDTDSDAINWVRGNIDNWGIEVQIGTNLFLVKGNFKDLKKIAGKIGFDKVSGIIYDLGVSTHQLKTVGRGFGFQNSDLLDMRMNQNEGESAKDVINTKTKEELYEIFTKFGEEKFAWQIADGVVRARHLKTIETTEELKEIVLKIRGKSGKDRTHPATRVFQALRIYVNSELDALKESLPNALDLLVKDGRLAVISFHSLEDRIVKLFMQNEEKKGSLRQITKKPIRPNMEEINFNASSRSGKLRIAVKN